MEKDKSDVDLTYSMRLSSHKAVTVLYKELILDMLIALIII